MSISWLQRRRKQDLLDLSAQAGLRQPDDLRKDEIVDALDEHLRANASILSRDPAFESYFGGRSKTPFKPRESTVGLVVVSETTTGGGATSDDVAEVKSVVKSRGRKSTKIKSEPSEEESPSSPAPATGPTSILSTTASSFSPLATAILGGGSDTRTPAPKSRRRSEIPGPPSPSQIADVVEHEATRIYDGLGQLYTSSHVIETVAWVREACSSVTAVQITFLLLEAFALHRQLMPWRYAFSIPISAGAGGAAIPVSLPDFFVLVTARYWSSALLWASTSLFVPVLLAYFYNLTVREGANGLPRYAADPLTFNVVKALATWLVYGQGVTFGFIDPYAAERVDNAIFGGFAGTIIGSAIGALAALYDASQRR